MEDSGREPVRAGASVLKCSVLALDFSLSLRIVTSIRCGYLNRASILLRSLLGFGSTAIGRMLHSAIST
jgi:hypothetical protein